MVLPPALLRQGDLNVWEYFGIAAALIAFFLSRRKRAFDLRLPAPRKAWQAAALTGALALVLRAALLPVMSVPVPGVHDEFSYLLQGDTFAHRRLTNPTHPMWRSFESIHILQRPTYQSMYQPMQGLFLAAGEVLGRAGGRSSGDSSRTAWIGVWISCSLMCAALTWMLYGYLPARWAFLGGLLAVARYGIFSYWMNSYFGGACAAIGGALLLGALPRIREAVSREHASTWPAALAAGTGLALLMNARPYEGLLLAIGVALPLNVRMFLRMLVPAGIIVAFAATGMGMYFHAVTGSAFKLPYEVNRQTYGWPMTQFWLAPVAVAPSNPQMRDYYNWELSMHRQFQSPLLFAEELWNKLRHLWVFFIGPALTLPLLLAGRGPWRDLRRWHLLWPFAIVLCGVLAGQSAVPQYLAPITGIVLLLIVAAIRHVVRTRYAALAYAALGIFLLMCVSRPLNLLPAHAGPYSWCCTSTGNLARSAIRNGYAKRKSLMIVRYGAKHNVHEEWVYNGAEIDAEPVVFARELDAQQNRRLIEYFHDRAVYLLEPDADPPRVSPYDMMTSWDPAK